MLKLQSSLIICLFTVLIQIFWINTFDKSSMTFSLNKMQGMYKTYKDRLGSLDHLSTLLGHSTPIFGNSSSLNYYYVNIYIGEPPQRQAVIIDTGSHLTAVPCMPYCRSCGKHINKYYDTKKSNSSQIVDCKTDMCKQFNYARCEPDNQCFYTMTYGEGSTLSGIIVEDTILFGDTFQIFKPVQLPFGCTQIENKLFFEQDADGIMGLGPNSKSFVNLLYEKSVIPHNVFSLCFAPNGGYFSVGGINTTMHKEEIKYINYTASGFYKVKLKDVVINGQDFNIKDNEYFTIIDSGTTLSYFPKKLYSDVEKQINAVCSQIDKCLGDSYDSGSGICFKIKENVTFKKFIESMPTFTFLFDDGVNYLWRPENYLYNYTDITSNDKRNTFCIGLTGWNSNEILLGSTWMHNHDIIFDQQEKRIGLVESNCASDLVIKVVPAETTYPTEPTSEKNTTDVDNSNSVDEPIGSPVAISDENNKHDVDVDIYIKLTIGISIIAVIIILLLSVALYKIRRGQSFLWIRVNEEDTVNSDRVLNIHQLNVDKIIKEMKPVISEI